MKQPIPFQFEISQHTLLKFDVFLKHVEGTVVLIGFYPGLFVRADPEQEGNTELVATDEEEDEEQCEGGEQ